MPGTTKIMKLTVTERILGIVITIAIFSPFVGWFLYCLLHKSH